MQCNAIQYNTILALQSGIAGTNFPCVCSLSNFKACSDWDLSHRPSSPIPQSGLFLAELSPFRQLQQSRSWLNFLNIHDFKIEFESTSGPPHRITFMEVNDPDFNAFESEDSQSSTIFGQTLLSLSRWEYQATTMLHENLNAAHHRTSSLIQTNHQKNLRRSSKIYRMDLSRVSFLWFRRMVHTAQMKLMKRKFEQWWNSNIYPKFLSLSSTWQVFIIQ